MSECPQAFGAVRIAWLRARAVELQAIRNAHLCPPDVFADADKKLDIHCRAFWPELCSHIDTLTAQQRTSGTVEICPKHKLGGCSYNTDGTKRHECYMPEGECPVRNATP